MTRRPGGLRGYGISETILKAGGSAVAMGLVAYGAWRALEGFIRPTSLLNEALLLGVPALLGGGLYLALIWIMRLPELQLIMSKVFGRLRR